MLGKIFGVFGKVFGTASDREIKRMWPVVAQVNECEKALESLSDDELRQKTTQWKEEFSKIEDDAALAAALKDALPEAFAVVKTACRRLCGTTVPVRGHELPWEMVPFDVQLIGGMAIHNRKISEMATGEGKTLVATLPVYLNALSGRGVHVVTVNDYLAARDSEWMGAVYKFLGLTVGCIQNGQPPSERRAQYECDITYGTNSEYGFDYLRDNGMARNAAEQVQRGHYFAIVDEVDSILIDEARVPLIISGPSVVHVDNSIYDQLKPAISSLVQHQQKLCARYLEDAKKIITRLDSDEKIENRMDVEREAGLLLLRVRNGNPKWAPFLKLMEVPAYQKLLSKAELELHSDQTKKGLYAEKEELFFAIDEKSHDADLTEKGRGRLSPNDPDAFMLPDLPTRLHEIDADDSFDAKQRLEQKNQAQQQFEKKAQTIHCISQLLKAYCLYEKDVQYVVQENKVMIVDEHTGRLMPGRRWSDGLHQAVEAKEGVTIEKETQTLATITIQNYFRLYTKLAGMTGTASTEANEFHDIYSMGVLPIPTNRPVQRKDGNDSVYKSKRERNEALLTEIKEIHQQGRPILVGTVSVDSSEQVSKMLKKNGLVHSVLNAKYHQQEAEIVARAGQKGSITIATNMAGRGTDIKLGPGVGELGGLHVIGSERHESRRIDRQLRGRCARQGDPGSSHFFISLEDDLMRLFASDGMLKIMERVGLEEGQELSHPMLNRSIESAQKRVEQMNFQRRKHTLEFDDVMNKQRQEIYGFRNDIMHSDDVHDRLMDIMEEVVVSKVEEVSAPDGNAIPDVEDWNIRPLCDWVNLNFLLAITEEELLKIAQEATEEPVKGSSFEDMTPAQFALCSFVTDSVRDAYELKIKFENPDQIPGMERFAILSAIDKLWQEHLYNMDSLRTAVGLRAYGQRDPLLEYKAEAFKLFGELTVSIKSEICHNIFRSATSLMAFEQFLQNLPRRGTHQTQTPFGGGAQAQPGGGDLVSEVNKEVAKAKPIKNPGPKVGRNDPCPCGSGKKYKQCCGR